MFGLRMDLLSTIALSVEYAFRQKGRKFVS